MTNESQTPDPIAMFTEAESDFRNATGDYIKALRQQLKGRRLVANKNQSLLEMESLLIVNGKVDGKSAELRKAQLIQLLAKDERAQVERHHLRIEQIGVDNAVVNLETAQHRISGSKRRMAHATTLLAYLTTAQDERMAMTPEGAAVGAES